MTLLLVLSLIAISTAQTIQVHEINNDRGYFMLQQGAIDLPENFDETIISINKTQLELAYFELESEYNKKSYLQNNLTKRYLSLANNERKIFHIRHKRGLVNAIGSGLRFLFGTLDDEDRNKIFNRLNALEEETLSKSDIDNILDHITENNKLIYILENSTNVLHNELTKKIVSDTFLNNVKTYYEHLKEIQLGLLLSKHGILNPKLFEIEKFGNISSKQLEMAKTSLWQSEEILYFVVSIPSNLTSYPVIRIIPMPSMSENIELIVDSSLKLTSINETLYEIKDSKIIEIRDFCIKNLLNNNVTNCNFQQNFEKQIEFLDPNIIIAKNQDEITLNQNCSNLAIKIKKNSIIHFENCYVVINNVKFASFNENEKLLIVPYVNEIVNKTVLPNTSLRELKINVTRLRTHNQKAMWAIIFSIFVLFVATIYLIYKLVFVQNKKFDVHEDVNSLREGRSNIQAQSLSSNVNTFPE